MNRQGIPGVEYGRIFGYYDDEDDRITLDPRQTDIELLDTAIHECCHRQLPNWSEAEIVKIGNVISQFVWDLGFRLPKEARKVIDKHKV